ncbi:MAG: DUF4167 domain-containing protein [Paracoccaceae bacterium]
MRSSKSRSRKSGRNNAPNRSVGNIINRVFDSSGPEGKVRGTPQQIIDKYNQLARDAQLGNDRVAMENFQQHAEHYLRLLAEAQREIDQRREQQERENRDRQSDRDQGQGSQGQGAQGQRDQGRDNNRDNPNRENGNRDNGNRDNDTRDTGQREGGYRETGNRDNRDGGNRDNRDGGNRDNSQREQPRQQNRERAPRNDQDAAERGTDHRRTAQPDVLDLGGESGLVETPESRSEAPAAPAPVTRSEPRAKSEPRSKPRAKAEPRASADQPALALSDAPAEGADQPKPKPRTRAPRKPREGTTGGSSTSGTPEAAE